MFKTTHWCRRYQYVVFLVETLVNGVPKKVIHRFIHNSVDIVDSGQKALRRGIKHVINFLCG